MTQDRLIWFQHFHKAAGHTVVDMAQRSCETLFHPHSNGNPLNADGSYRDIWSLDETGLRSFVEECRIAKVSMVCTEWAVPDVDALARIPGVTLITVLRDPLHRFISNYTFDYRNGYTNSGCVRDYVDSALAYTSHNYYCRMLTGKHDPAEPLSEQDLEQAGLRLEKFRHVACLENPRGLTDLSRHLGWVDTGLVLNRSHPKLERISALLMKRNFRLLKRTFKPRAQLVPKAFREEFIKHNRLDYALLSRFCDSHAESA